MSSFEVQRTISHGSSPKIAKQYLNNQVSRLRFSHQLQYLSDTYYFIDLPDN